jgi:hypothetical protein
MNLILQSREYRARLVGDVVMGKLDEVGFPDLIQQMWAAFLMEREGGLDGRFGCATPAEEALNLSPECTAE